MTGEQFNDESFVRRYVERFLSDLMESPPKTKEMEDLYHAIPRGNKTKTTKRIKQLAQDAARRLLEDQPHPDWFDTATDEELDSRLKECLQQALDSDA